MSSISKIALISIILSIALLSYTKASNVTILEPYYVVANNGSSIYIGKVGPGQTFYVNISSSAYTSSGKYVNLGWNEFVVANAPSGWTVENSSLNTKELSVLIKPDKSAQSGTYKIEFKAIDIGNYSGTGTDTIYGYINVTPNVFKLNVTPSVVQASPATPSKIFIHINNTGVSDNPFEIYLTGLPGWNSSEPAIALHHTTGTFTYTIFEDIPGVYKTQLYVSSLTSPSVIKEENITIRVNHNLLNDYYAIGEGAPTFPIIYEPAYDVMYIISYIARHI